MTLIEAIEFSMPCVNLTQNSEWCEIALETMKKYQELISDNAQPKIGRWIHTLEDWNKWECSECGFTKRTDIHVDIGYKYCPNCGCCMESEVSDANVEATEK